MPLTEDVGTLLLPQDHASTSVKELMVGPERKRIESIALNVGHGQVSALQEFINSAPWNPVDVQAEIQAVFADELVPTAADRSIGGASRRRGSAGLAFGAPKSEGRHGVAAGTGDQECPYLKPEPKQRH